MPKLHFRSLTAGIEVIDKLNWAGIEVTHGHSLAYLYQKEGQKNRYQTPNNHTEQKVPSPGSDQKTLAWAYIYSMQDMPENRTHIKAYNIV